jgi:alcohol dehydrogenase (cytochrome c)
MYMPTGHAPRRARVLCAWAIVLCSASLACRPREVSFYTLEQAERGGLVYRARCAGCHGTNLMGGGFVSPLAGKGVLAWWGRRGLTVDDLFYVVRARMPPGATRSMTTEQQLDVVAFLLQQNGLRAGTEPLRAEAEYLAGLSLTPAWPTTAGRHTDPPRYVEGEGGTRPRRSSPTADELIRRRASRVDWLYHTGDYGGSRYSAASQITDENVAELGEVCRYTLKEQTNFQTGPIVHEGTMYVTTLHHTVAIDARRCVERWTHVWDAPAGDVWLTNRGVALSAGRVVRATSDGYLVALDAGTGALLWARQVADTQAGETFTMAPLIWRDLVLVGPAGGENAIQGWVGAFSLEDGTPVWRFNLVPRPGEPGYETWDHTTGFPIGGGATWTPLSMDVDAGIVFVPATNPAPDFPADVRGGDNLYTNAAVALDARTGRLAWYDQLVPSDEHDWDLTQVSPVFSASVFGRRRNLLAAAGKDGILRLIDRDTREHLWSTAVTTVKNADARVTVEGTHACPGVLGGVEWNGPAYSPVTNMLYTPAVDWCGTFYKADSLRFVPGASYLGGTYTSEGPARGWVTATAVETGEVAWRYASERPMVGAVIATAGGLVLAGELTGDLIAFRASTGDELARIATGAPIGGGVVTYMVDGRQYVAVATGHPSAYWDEDAGRPPTIVVLTLNDGS